MVVGYNNDSGGFGITTVDDQPNAPDQTEQAETGDGPPSTLEELWNWYASLVRNISEEYFGIAITGGIGLLIVGLVVLVTLTWGGNFVANVIYNAVEGYMEGYA